MKRYIPRPTHFAFGKPGDQHADSPCGYTSMWHRGLGYTRKPRQVTCIRCKAWLRKEARRLAASVVIEGTAL